MVDGIFDGSFNPSGDMGIWGPGQMTEANSANALPGMDYGSLGLYGNAGLPGQNLVAQQDTNWPGILGGISQGLGGLTSLAQIYGMFQNLGLQKKAFKFAQEGTKRNFNASATGFNNEITRRENLASAYGAANPSGDYGSLQSYGRVDKWT
jgi:hypothetical protein